MEAKSFEINGINIDIKDEFARQQLDKIANELGRNEDNTEIDMGTTATNVRGAIKELKDNMENIGSPTDEQVTNAINSAIEQGLITGGGLTQDIKTALLNCFANVAWSNENGKTYYDNLVSALNPSTEPTEPEVVTLQSISAEYNGESVVAGTNASDITGIIVTGNYSDGTSKTETGWTISGIVGVGVNTFVIELNGKTCTVSITGIEPAKPNLLGELKSYKMKSTLEPMYIVEKNGDDYTLSINSEYTGTTTFQNGRLLGEVNIVTGKTYKLSITQSLSSVIYLYGCNLPASIDAVAGTGTLITNLEKLTNEITFTADADYTALRLAPSSSSTLTLKGLKLEEV